METNKCATCKHWNPKKAGEMANTNLRHAHWGRISLQVPDAHMPATHTRIGRGERCARALAGEILARTAKSWGVTK